MNFLATLAQVIRDRQANPTPNSYTASLLAQGTPAVAQKVGEEAVEVVVAALSQSDERLISESADLLYMLLILLAQRGISLEAVEAELISRHPPTAE